MRRTNYPTVCVVLLAFAFFTGCRKDKPKPCKDCEIAYKPNIYLYPEKEVRLQVSLSFPQGGAVIKSIPSYNGSWNVTVSPTGKINGMHDYLFYESNQPGKWQRETGWLVKTDTLQRFFENNLSSYNFKPNEIKDFTDYWVPRLKGESYYAIYPQEKAIIENLIQLHLSVEPQSSIRLFYVIKGSQGMTKIKEHIIPNPSPRIGFNVAEWGVVLD